MLLFMLSFAAFASAQSGTILYNFTGSKDGAYPKARLLVGPNSTFIGTTTEGGASGLGEVFQLAPGPKGNYVITILYSFQGGADGDLPAAGVIRDRQGNLYGTLYQGGANGHGAVFELSPTQQGTWTKKLLYSFIGSSDGGQPVGGLVFDAGGNLYGTTPLDGAYGQGVVYRLSPDGQGGWTETVLHSFVSQSPDGQGPAGSLTFDKAGNLYGLTVQGGSANQGTVFELQPDGNGGWTESVAYSFKGGIDGAHPATSDLIFGKGGLFGTTTDGGTAGLGTVFQLVNQSGRWKERVLYSFPGGVNGGNPYAGLVHDSAGNLYGTTASGVFGAGGVVFELAKANGVWTESVLYTFDNPGNGSYAGLAQDSAGILYGTTEFGGPQLAGNVFAVIP
jgi:uncharacterized repeat protein (TIGR03803 family)